jgi:ribose 5-phosphate isomerase A
MVLGLGTGHAATAFIEALGKRVQSGPHIRGVPTSHASASLARKLGIEVVDLDAVDAIDVAVDGADEVDPHCNLIKGYGGALVREKIVASAARQFVILVGAEKLVGVLGAHGRLPVEVLPFAFEFCRRRLEKLGLPTEPRTQDGSLFVTDNGNHILDLRIMPPGLTDPGGLELALRSIPGIVGTGLFLAMASLVLIQDGERVVGRRGLERG